MIQTDVVRAIQQKDERFHRIFARINVMWSVVSAIIICMTAYFVVRRNPSYLFDWHIVAIVILGVLILIAHRRAATTHVRQWPRPLRSSLFYWSLIYGAILLLTSIDTGFAYCLYIPFGIAFALFESWPLITMVMLIFITVCFFEGLLSWPFSSAAIGGLFGNAMGFLSITLISMMTQYVMKERTDRSRLLQELATTHAELEEAHQKLAASMMQEQELAVLRERTRLAREMHDTLGHALVLISVKLEAAQRLRTREPERCDRELDATKEIVRESMRELRASIANLRSPALEREPASRALSRYAQEMALRADLHVTYDLRDEIEGLPELVEEILWKVGQEALTNIEKHAHAKNVVLHISRHSSQIHLQITDDGIGLPWQQGKMLSDGSVICSSPQGHYGLSGMSERIANIGGKFSLRPATEHGTIVEVAIPLVEALL